MTSDTGKPRLRELEAEQRWRRDQAKNNMTGQTAFVAVAEGRVEGYRMALVDLDARYGAVVAAAQRVIDNCEFCQAALNGMGGCFGEHATLRDALAGMKE